MFTNVLIREFTTNTTGLNTYTLTTLIAQNPNDAANGIGYSNNLLQNCDIYQIDLIPPVDYVSLLQATVDLSFRVISM
jgi:hypothetical protein